MGSNIALHDLLGEVVTANASDLHISVGRHPTLRVDGALIMLTKYPVFTPELTEALAEELLTAEQQAFFKTEKEIDFSYAFADKARFRVNVFRQRGYVSAALRLIPTRIRTVEELSLPQVLHRFTKPSQGFFLCVGPAGHGKSTTLAALVDEINHNRSEHIITIEDPIEYAFTQDRCIVDQREVHQDTKGFHRALRSALRQDPNALMIGEMRDPETISAAITAAETGHLIFASLHTNNAAQTMIGSLTVFRRASRRRFAHSLRLPSLGLSRSGSCLGWTAAGCRRSRCSSPTPRCATSSVRTRPTSSTW